MEPDDVAALAVATTLADGGVVRLRPIRPEDGPRLADGFARLSPHSRFLRFFSPLDHLTTAQLQYFTEIDYVDHFAWVAIVDLPGPPALPLPLSAVTAPALDAADPDTPWELGVGVARYIRSRSDPTAAEAAVAVADDYHRRGIGTVLLQALAAVALTRGITAFHLLVRTDNAAMIAAMHELDADRAHDPNDEPSVIRFVLDLPHLADELRDTSVWRVFRRVAEGSPELDLHVSRRWTRDAPPA